MVKPRVQFTNFRQLNRSFSTVSDELPKEMLKGSKDAGEKTVLPEAQSLYTSFYTQRTSKHVKKMRIKSSKKSVAIVYGGARFPEAGGQEFGSDTYQQFAPQASQEDGGSGRFLWKAANDKIEELSEALVKHVDKMLGRAGF